MSRLELWIIRRIWISPLQYSRTVLVDQRLVVRLQALDVGHLRGLGVQVKLAVQSKEKRPTSGDGKSSTCSTNDEVLTWTPGPRAACSDLCGCTDACSLRGSARGRRNGSESCTSPEEQQIERRGGISASVTLLSYLPPLGWSSCWTSSPGRDTLPTKAQRSGRAKGQTGNQTGCKHCFAVIHCWNVRSDCVIGANLQILFCDELKFQKKEAENYHKENKIELTVPSWPQDMYTFSSPQLGAYIPHSVLKKQ